MAELVAIKLPIETGNITIGLDSQTAVNELKNLLHENDLDNRDIEIPSKNDPKFPKNVNNQELKNFLTKNSGTKIRVLSDSNSKPKLLTF